MRQSVGAEIIGAPRHGPTHSQTGGTEMTNPDGPLAALEPLVGAWGMVPKFPSLPPVEGEANVTFEWMPGEQFLIQRWDVPVPEAPDGIAILGLDPQHEGRYLQHYFDTRGVARTYKMTFADGVWKLRRDEPDFSPLDFAQRFTGTFSADGSTITGAWEINHDGATWEHDFDLTYTRRA
jgi:hypothetical protein